MSHELRTPLNAIIGFTGTVLMGLPGPLNDDQRDQLQTIEGSATHLLSLINDLLDLAKIESGKLELRLEKVTCQGIVHEVLSTLRPMADAKGLRLEAQMPEEKLSLDTDRRAFTQILLNLTNNAIKFTEKGHIQLAIDCRQENGRPLTAIHVVDTGIGIREEDQAKMFQAFHQLKEGRIQRQGTGLGLHLSQKLAALLGWQIQFQSEYGKGSTFTLFVQGK